jgi:virulence-associated protein E
MNEPSIPIRCPWITEHSCDSGPTETVYFPAGTGSFEVGHFKCLHASHAGKTDADFLEAIGWTRDGFENISGPEDGAGPETFATEDDFIGDPTAPTQIVVPHPLALPPFERTPKTGKIKPIINNLSLFMSWLAEQGEGVRFDVFCDEIILDTPAGSRSFTDADYTRLQRKAEIGANGFAPISHDLLRRAVHASAQDRCFDSAADWMRALPPWDGVSRVNRFCHTHLGASLTNYSIAVSRYLWTAMAGRILAPGSQADMAIILVSPQGTGKSSSVRAMAPRKDYYIDLSLSDRDADLARLTRGKTIVELSELRGLHTKEMESIKSFVTRLDSEWVPKYFEMRTVYRRRFVMIGTTNSDEFLGDVTGERRWLPLRVGTQAIELIKADHTQLWAEAKSLFEEFGIIWQDAQRLGAKEHAEFSTHDVLIDQIAEWLETEQFGRKPSTCKFLHLLQVMKDGLNYDARELTRPNQMRVADALTRLGFVRVTKWVDGRSQKVWERNLST